MGAVSDLLLQARGEDVSAGRTIEQLGAELEAFGGIDAEAELGVDTGTAHAEIDRLGQQLQEFGRQKEEATLGVDTTRGHAEADALEARLKRVRGEGKLDLDVAAAAAKLEVFRAAAGRNVKIGLELNNADLAKLIAARTAVEGVEKAASSLSSAGGGAGGGGGLGTLNIPGIPAMSGQAAAAIAGVLIPVVTSLIGFLGALVASAAAAAAGLGALGVAAVAAFGPIGALAAVAMVRITQASQALDSYKTAHQSVVTAEGSLEDAESSLTSAQQQQQQAQDSLTQARHDAAQQIRDDLRTAVEGLDSAEQTLTETKYQERQAEDQLTLARQAARRAIIDEQLAAEGAALGHKGAVLQLAEARHNLNELLSQQGTQGGPSGLDIRQARLQIQQAEFDVERTRVDSARAERDLNTAEQQGVSGAPAVVQARHEVRQADQQVVDAHTKVRDAERELRRAQAATVEQTPSVIAARQQVASSEHQVANARRQVAQATERLDVAQQKAAKAWKAFQDSRGALEVLRIVKRIGRELNDAVDPILRGMGRGLRELMPLIRSLRGPLERLGEAMGHAFVRLMRELTSPAWERFFRILLRNSAEFARVGVRGFILLLRILRNITEAGLPFLIRGLRDVNHFLADMARGSKDVDLSGVVHQLGLWIRLTGAVARVFLAFVRAGAGAGGELVDTLTRGLNTWADWLNSTEGKNRLAKFFEDTLPLASALFDLLGQLTLLILELGEYFAPIFEPVIRSLGIVVKWVNRILDLFNMIPAPIRKALVAIGNPMVGLAMAIQVVDRVAERVFGALPGLARGAGRAISSAWGWLRDRARGIWHAIAGFITGPLGDAFRWLRTAVGNIVDWLGDRVGDMAQPFEDVAGAIVDAFNGIKGPLVDAVNWIISNVINRIPGVEIDTIPTVETGGAKTHGHAGRAGATSGRDRHISGGGYAAGGIVGLQGGGIGDVIRKGAHVASGAVDAIQGQFGQLHAPGGMFGFLPPWMKGLGSWIWHKLLDVAEGGVTDVGGDVLKRLVDPTGLGGMALDALGLAGGGFAGKVGGTGSGDTQHFMAEPGEGLWYVLNRNAMKALEWVNGAFPRFQHGGAVGGGGPGAAALDVPAPTGARAQQTDLQGLAQFRRRMLAILDGLRDQSLALWRALWAAIEGIARNAQGDALGDAKDFSQALTKDWRDLKGDASKLWTDIGQAIWAPIHSTFDKIEHDALPGLEHGFRDTALDIGRMFTGAGRIVGQVARFIVDAVNKVIAALGDKKNQLPSLKLGDLPDPASLIPGHYAGGIVETPMYRVGEEAPQHKEVVLTENPKHRARNLGLWSAAGRMLGVPGFAAGGTFGGASIKPPAGGYPDAMGALPGLDALAYIVKKAFGLSVISGLRPGSITTSGSLSDHSWGGAVDLSNSGGSGTDPSSMTSQMTAAALALAKKAGFPFHPGDAIGTGGPIKQLIYGTPLYGGHFNHVHVALWESFAKNAQKVAQWLAGLKGVVGAGAKLLPDIKVKGQGPVADIVRAAIEKMTDAGNARLQRIEGRAVSGGALPPGVAEGSVAQQAFKAAKAARAPARAALGLFEALLAESGMGTTSSNVLQLTGTKIGGIGPGSSPAAQSFAFLTRGWGYQDPAYGDVGGMIHGAKSLPDVIVSRIAQAVQGSAFTSGSNYQAQQGPASSLLRRLGYPGFGLGGRFANAMLGLFGGEPGAGEMALLPSGTEIIPSDITSRLSQALMGHPVNAAAGSGGAGGGPTGDPWRVVVNGDLISDHREPVQVFHGDRKVAQWVRDLAAEESDGDRRHGLRLERMSRN